MLTRFAFAAALAASLAGAATLSLAPAADAFPNLPGAEFKAGKAFSADFGSKHMVGYFMPEAGSCAVTLMVAERLDPDYAQGTGARVQMAVAPGRGALIGSGEGTTVSVTCAADAAAVKVLTQPNGV